MTKNKPSDQIKRAAIQLARSCATIAGTTDHSILIPGNPPTKVTKSAGFFALLEIQQSVHAGKITLAPSEHARLQLWLQESADLYFNELTAPLPEFITLDSTGFRYPRRTDSVPSLRQESTTLEQHLAFMPTPQRPRFESWLYPHGCAYDRLDRQPVSFKSPPNYAPPPGFYDGHRQCVRNITARPLTADSPINILTTVVQDFISGWSYCTYNLSRADFHRVRSWLAHRLEQPSQATAADLNLIPPDETGVHIFPDGQRHLAKLYTDHTQIRELLQARKFADTTGARLHESSRQRLESWISEQHRGARSRAHRRARGA